MVVEEEPKRALGASSYYIKGYDPTQMTPLYDSGLEKSTAHPVARAPPNVQNTANFLDFFSVRCSHSNKKQYCRSLIISEKQ